jgi:hypothetical protein
MDMVICIAPHAMEVHMPCTLPVNQRTISSQTNTRAAKLRASEVAVCAIKTQGVRMTVRNLRKNTEVPNRKRKPVVISVTQLLQGIQHPGHMGIAGKIPTECNQHQVYLNEQDMLLQKV